MKKIIINISVILILSAVFFNGCFRMNGKEPAVTSYITTVQNEVTTENYPTEVYTTIQPESTTEEIPQVSQQPVTLPPFTLPPVTQAPETQAPVTQAPSTKPAETRPDYSKYSKNQVLSLYKEALNKTRAYTGTLSVHHKEGFTGDVVEASPGGDLTKQLAGYIISAIAKPTEAEYSFSGGKALNEDGESIPLLLPQRTEFTLPQEGVKSASVSENNGYLTIDITLVSESVGMGETPKYNSTSIGFLDTSSISFKIVTIKSCTITYTGSTIKAVIRPDGYIESCSYVINLSTTGEVSGLGITGGGTIAGAQTEDWILKW